MTVNDHVVIVYDYINPDYEHTDGIIKHTIDPDWFQVERWDGTMGRYHEACIQKVEDYYQFDENDVLLPELPDTYVCSCPIETLMISGCKCGGI